MSSDEVSSVTGSLLSDDSDFPLVQDALANPRIPLPPPIETLADGASLASDSDSLADEHHSRVDTWRIDTARAAEPDVGTNERASTGGAGPAHGSVADMVNAPPVMSFGAVKDLTLEEGKGGNGVQTTALYKRPSAPAAQPPLSPILVDSDMPTRARIVTLVSYLTSKMFWPFVGGVMFGLGEAFARNVVGPRFGWPKPVAPSVKIRVVPGGSNRSVTIRKSTDRATGERVSVIQAD